MQWKPNVTVAAVIENDGRFLMIEETSKGRLVINQPAGHLESGETFLEAVQREVLEETGWRFIPQGVTGIYLYPSPDNAITYLRICFHGECHDHQPDRPLDDGIVRALWMTREELTSEEPRWRSPMVMRCIDDYLSGHCFALDFLKHYAID